MSKDASDKHYSNNKERLQKSLVKAIIVFLKKKKKEKQQYEREHF